MSDQLTIDLTIDVSSVERPLVMVDDEEMDYKCARRYHERSVLPNPLVHFSNGFDFLDYLALVKLGDKPLPVLVLMDINMPRMNGFEVVEKMREDEAFRDIPVVAMLSSSTDRKDMDRAAEAGASSYLVKPYQPKDYQTFFDSLAA